MNDLRTAPYIVIGAGLSGLSASVVLSRQSMVLEKEAEVGGLVRGFKLGDYWFDLVPHMLYFPDDATEQFTRPLVGDVLRPAVPDGWVETAKGTTRYPIQANLSGLEQEVAIACVRDLAKVTFGGEPIKPANLAESLRITFGDSLCEVFMYPYNRKVWARNLTDVAPSLMWSISRPSFDSVLRGAFGQHDFRTYNASGWYPRPGPDAPKMTMALLSDALAKHAGDILLNREVVRVDLAKQLVASSTDGRLEVFHYERGLITTMPMTKLAAICEPLPEAIRRAAQTLDSMAVWMVALTLPGPRPMGRGKYRYYADESLCFTRLIHMHEYDADTCPSDGWSIMAEILERSDSNTRDPEALARRVESDARRAGAIPPESEVIQWRAWRCDPAYVVESAHAERVKADFVAFLERHRVYGVGRYGRWQYSSMGQVIRDGMLLGQKLAATG